MTSQQADPWPSVASARLSGAGLLATHKVGEQGRPGVVLVQGLSEADEFASFFGKSIAWSTSLGNGAAMVCFANPDDAAEAVAQRNGGLWLGQPVSVQHAASNSKPASPSAPSAGKEEAPETPGAGWRISSMPEPLTPSDMGSPMRGMQSALQPTNPSTPTNTTSHMHDAFAMSSPGTATAAPVDIGQPWGGASHGLDPFSNNSAGFIAVDPSQLLSRWSNMNDPVVQPQQQHDLPHRLDFGSRLDSVLGGPAGAHSAASGESSSSHEHLMLQQAAAAWSGASGLTQGSTVGAWPLDLTPVGMSLVASTSASGHAGQAPMPTLLASSHSSPPNSLPEVLDGPMITPTNAPVSISGGGAVGTSNSTGVRRSLATIARDDSNKLATVATLGASFAGGLGSGGLAGSPWSTPTQQDKMAGGASTRLSSSHVSVVGFGGSAEQGRSSRNSLTVGSSGSAMDDITDSQLLGALAQVPGWQQLSNQDRLMLLHAAQHEVAVQQQQAVQQQAMAEVVIRQMLQQQQQSHHTQQPVGANAAAAASSALLGLPPSPLKSLRPVQTGHPMMMAGSQQHSASASAGFSQMPLARGQSLGDPMRIPAGHTSMSGMHGGMHGGMSDEQMLHMMQLNSDMMQLGSHSNQQLDEMGWGHANMGPHAEVAQLLAMHPQSHHNTGPVPPGAHSPTSLLHGDYNVGGINSMPSSRNASYNNNNNSNAFARASRHASLRTGHEMDGPGQGPHSSGGVLGGSGTTTPRSRQDSNKLPHKLVAAGSQVGLTNQMMWALLRHPSLLDMLVKEREALRSLPALPATPLSKISTGAMGAGVPPGPSGGLSARRLGNGAGGPHDAVRESLDPARRQEEMTKVQRLLCELMSSTATYLNSAQVHTLLAALAPISVLYDTMHDLPVVQKRKRCGEMAELRVGLLQQQAMRDTVTLLATLRHHLHTLTSRLLLLADSTSEGVPLDILLGCICSELLGLLKPCMPQEVLELFESFLPHARLALLVFVEFTSVDPAPPK